MRLNEFVPKLNTYMATVKVNGSSYKTSITAESASHARILLNKLYGTGNLVSLREAHTELEEHGAGTKVLSPEQLQVKSLSDREAQLKQQKKQLQARQALAKAEEKMRDSVKPV